MIELVNTKYGKMYVRTGDQISEEVKAGRYFEPELIEALKPYVKNNTTIIDVGANIGTFTLALSYFSSNTCEIHAFEPQKFIFNSLLSKTVEINNLTNVKLYNAAVGQINKDINMALFEPYSLRVYSHRASNNMGCLQIGIGGEPAKMIAIDSLNLENVSILKTDTEGFEPMVLLGAKETIKKYRPVVLFEWHGYIISPDMVNTAGVTERLEPFDFFKEINYSVTNIPVHGVANYLCIPL